MTLLSSTTALLVIAIMCAQLSTANLESAESIRFPTDAGVIDVTQEPYLADPTGATDATAAIQAALSDHPTGNCIIYLPKGTYLISDTLRWPKGKSEGGTAKRTILQGESQLETIILLQDACSGFDEQVAGKRDKSERPIGKAMIWTGVAPAQRFRNAVRNLTVNAGKNNPSAIGIQFNTSNQGGLIDVSIIADTSSGSIGLDVGYTSEIGPLLAQNVTISGFDIGVSSWGAVNSITMVDLTLKNQRECGILNNHQVLSLENFTSTNTVPALNNLNGDGVVAIVGGTLTADPATDSAAIENKGVLTIRNLTTVGYATTVHNKTGTKTDATESTIAWYCSHPTNADVFAPDSPVTPLNLPIRAVPKIPWDDLEHWANPVTFGGIAGDDGDDTAAIQAAIDSGATTVYLPNGKWTLSGTLYVRGNVRRFVGCEASVVGESIIEVADGSEPIVAIERMEFLPIHEPGPSIRHTSKRTLVLGNMRMRRVGYAYEAVDGAGDVFFNDVAGDSYTFAPGQHVWARQINPEGDTPMLINRGADVWVLGLKTENVGPALHAQAGRTEIVNAMIYANSRREKNTLFVIDDGAEFSVTMGESSFRKLPFKTLVEQTHNGETRTLKAGDTPSRGEGSAIGCYRTGPKGP